MKDAFDCLKRVMISLLIVLAVLIVIGVLTNLIFLWIMVSPVSCGIVFGVLLGGAFLATLTWLCYTLFFDD